MVIFSNCSAAYLRATAPVIFVGEKVPNPFIFSTALVVAAAGVNGNCNGLFTIASLIGTLSVSYLLIIPRY
jgi:hypothetical protein